MTSEHKDPFEELIEAGLPPVGDEEIEACLAAAPPLPDGLADRALSAALASGPRAAESIGTEVPQVSSGPPLKIKAPAATPIPAARSGRPRQRSFPALLLAGLAGVGLGAAAFSPLGKSLKAALWPAERFRADPRQRGDAALGRGDYVGALEAYLSVELESAGFRARPAALRLGLGKARLGLAREKEREGKLQRARALLDQAEDDLLAACEAEDPEEARYFLAECRRRIGDVGFPLAELFIQAWSGGSSTVISTLARARSEAYRGRTQRAVDLYSLVIEADPTIKDALTGRAEALRRLRRFREALLDLERAALDGDDPEIRFLRAQILLGAGDRFSARIEVDRGLERHKGSAFGLGLRAHLRLEAGEAQEAMADAQAAIKLDPRCYYPYLVRGLMLEATNPMGARDDFQAARERAPDLAEPRFLLGRNAQARGDLTKALASYNAVVWLDPGDYRSYANRGTVSRMLERFDQSLRDLDKSVDLAPDNGSVRFQRSKARWVKLRKSKVLYADARWDGVLEDLNFALKDPSVAPEAHGRRGYLRYKRKEYDGALDDYNAAIGLDAMRPDAYIWYGYRALLFTTLGRFKEGLSDGERFLKDAPGTHENRSAVRKAMKRCREALEKAPR